MRTEFKISEGLRRAAELVFISMAAVETLRAEVKEIQERILSKHCFPYAKRLSKYAGCGPVLNADHDYLLSEHDADIYYHELNEAYQQAGYNTEEGNYPVLIAECTCIDAKKILVKEAEYLTHIKYNQLFKPATKYNRYIDHILSICAPFIDKNEVSEWMSK